VSGSLGRILAIARKEIRQLLRDRLTFGMVIGVPLMQLLLFGYAINQDVRHLRAAVADQAGTGCSRQLVADAEASQVVDVVARANTAEELEVLLRRGAVLVAILIPPDFERRLMEGKRPPAQLMVDGSDPIILQSSRGLLDLPLCSPRAAPRPRTASLELRAYYNPGRRSPVQIVPGLIGVILTMTMTLFTAVAIVRERERGNLEFLITTPVRTPELMAGKILPYVGIGMLQVSVILTVGSALFRVPIQGSLLDVYAVGLVFVIATLTLGLVISTVARTQFQAFQLTFFTFLPQILLSGFMFPFDGMPRAARALAELFPLTHFVRLIRGVMLRGAGIGEVSRDVWPLALFFAVMLTIAVTRFRKRLD